VPARKKGCLPILQQLGFALSRCARKAVLLELLFGTVLACAPSSAVDRMGVRVVDAAGRRTPADRSPVDETPVSGAGPRDGDAPAAETSVDARALPPDAGPADAPVDCCALVGQDASSRPDGSSGPESSPAPDAAVSPDGPRPPDERIPLPLVVTEYFPHQGWFADADLAGRFEPGSTIIRQEESNAGPCASRLPGARGRCLDVTYSPPGGLVAPAGGGWVGSYFLAALRADHPEQTPPLQSGDGNWGIEPGLRVARDATRVSFTVATDQPGLMVTFLVGSTQDDFLLPALTVSLTGTWVRHTMSLAGVRYDRVLTPLGWQLSGTTTRAHFYLDDMVWER
jgi:hypothetical protein